MYQDTVSQMKKMLENVGRWLDKAVEHGDKRKFDPAVLLNARLAPDQYALVRQVQAACDAAKFAAARVAGKEAPKHPDTEQTVDEIRARLASVVEYLGTFSAADFEGAATRMVVLPFIPGKGLRGHDYFTELAVPNFYFHVTHAYAILRHNGVELGKYDYIGGLTLQDV